MSPVCDFLRHKKTTALRGEHTRTSGQRGSVQREGAFPCHFSEALRANRASSRHLPLWVNTSIMCLFGLCDLQKEFTLLFF